MSVFRAIRYILLFFLALPSVVQCGWEDPVQLDSAEGAYPTLSYSPDGDLRIFYSDQQTNKMVVRKRAQGQTEFSSEVTVYNDARAVGVHYAGGPTIDLAVATCYGVTILKSTDDGDSFGFQDIYAGSEGHACAYLPLFFTEDSADLRLFYGYMDFNAVLGDRAWVYYALRQSGTWDDSGTYVYQGTTYIRGAYEKGDDVCMVTSRGVLYSSDNGINYTLTSPEVTTNALKAADMAIGISNRLYLLHYYTYGAGPNDKHLTFTYSDDNGASWHSPQILIAEGSDNMFYPIFTVDGNRMVVAWMHGVSGSGYQCYNDIKCTISEDGGQTWGPVETIFSVTGDELLHHSGVWDIASRNGRASIVYATFDDQSSDEHVYIKDEYPTNAITVTMTSTAPDPTWSSPIPVTVIFSEDVTGFTNTDITPGNGTVDDFTTVSSSNYTFNLTPTNQGLITADIPADVAQGASSNYNVAADQFSRVYDTVAPSTDNAGIDFDGDGLSDLTIYHESSGYWYILSVSGEILVWGVDWGGEGYVPVPGDYNGDGVSDLAVYHEGTGVWYILTVSGEFVAIGLNWGFEGCIPVSGDYDGDGISDLALFHEATGTWYILTVSGELLASGMAWGFTGCVPVSGDYDGDGISDLALFHEATGTWYILTISGELLVSGVAWGFTGCVPVSGDYDGNSVSDLAVYDETTGTWYILSVSGELIAMGLNWGFEGCIPVRGDYDGDGIADIAVYHESSGYWFILLSGNWTIYSSVFGGPGYIPVGVVR